MRIIFALLLLGCMGGYVNAADTAPLDPKGEPAVEDSASSDGRLETTAGDIGVSSSAPVQGDAGLQSQPALPRAVKPKLPTTPAAGYTPPQPKAPCGLNLFWNGADCVDDKTLFDYARSNADWSNDEWRSYFFSIMTKRKLPRAMPAALAAAEAEFVSRGASLQRNSAGELRGRIFLPTGDPEKPWDRAVDVVGAGGWCKPWGWAVR